MDYEKRYNEIVKAVKELRDVNPHDEGINEWINDKFPELAESEDEKIRKAVVDAVVTLSDSPLKTKMLAWLEKQGEHANFRNKIQIGDKVTRNQDGVLVNLSQLKRVAKKDEKQGKNNMGISEATKQKLEDNLNKALEKETPESWNKFLDEQGEQKPADDIERRYNPCYNMSFEEAQEYISKRGFDIPWTDCDVFVDFRYVTQTVANILRWADDNPRQNPAEWSKEDEKMLSNIVKDLVHPWNEYIPDRIEDEIKWLKNKLKSLKERYTWKPSEGHLKALEDAMNKYHGSYSATLCQLYGELEKLKK